MANTFYQDKVMKLHVKVIDAKRAAVIWPQEIYDAMVAMISHCNKCPDGVPYTATPSQKLYLQTLVEHCKELNRLFMVHGYRIESDGSIRITMGKINLNI